MFRLTVGRGTPSFRPAAEKLPPSTDATNSDIACRRSMLILSNIEKIIFEYRGLSELLIGTIFPDRADGTTSIYLPRLERNGHELRIHGNCKHAQRESGTGREWQRFHLGQVQGQSAVRSVYRHREGVHRRARQFLHGHGLGNRLAVRAAPRRSARLP